MDISLKGYIKRFAVLLFGLMLCACGIALTFNSYMGLSPWDMLFDGFAKQLTKLLGTQVMIGTLSQIIGGIILIIDVILKEKIGFGTLLNVWLIGKFTNVILKYNLFPVPQAFVPRFLMMLLGFVVLGFGIYFYMRAGMGAGPRDSLMIALARRNLPVSLARNSLEFFAFVVGYIAGGTVGIGTVISVFIIGYILKYVFRLFNYDMTAVKHESVFDTLNNLKKAIVKK